MKLTHTRKGRWDVNGSQHNTVEEAFETADNQALDNPGTVVVVTPPSFEVLAKADAAPPADPPPPTDVPPPDDEPPDPPADDAPAEPPASGPPKVVSQELIPSKYEVKVGESFTVAANMLYDDQTSKPVGSLKLGWDTKVLAAPDMWGPWFTAIAPGLAKITNVYGGFTGRTSVTIVPNDDGEVFPPPPTKAPAPAPAPKDPNAPPAPPKPPAAPGVPAPSVIDLAPPVSPVGSGPHAVRVEVVDGADRLWFAEGHTGDDFTAPGLLACIVNEAGEVHPRFQSHFFTDCVHVAVNRMDNRYDEVGCKSLKVWYDGEPVEVPASSYDDGTYTFWRGCWMPPIRYGKQAQWDASKIRWDLLPTYTKDIQKPISNARWNFTWNGLGATTMAGMASTGERGEIGYMQQLYMSFLLNPSDETWHAVRMAEDWSCNWSMAHVCEPATGGIIKYTDYGMLTIMPPIQSGTWQSSNPIAAYGGSYNGDVLTPPKDGWRSSGSPFGANGAHLTSYGMLAAMITGAAHDKLLCSFWGNYPLMDANPGYLRSGGVVLGAQRRAAWCMRSLFIAAYISDEPDYFLAETKRNIAIINNFPQNEFGIMDTDVVYGGKGDAYKCKGVPLWMIGYVGMTFEPIARKMPEALPFARYIGKLEALYMALPYYIARTLYVFIIYGPDGKLLPSLKEMVRMSLATAGYDTAHAAAVVDSLTAQEAYDAVQADYSQGGKTWAGKCVNGVADFIGSPWSSDSYPANARASIIAAANCGTSGIEKAVAIIEAMPTKPAYATDFRNQKYHLRLKEA